jgi:hypothetical protein
VPRHQEDAKHKQKKITIYFITSGRWVIFFTPKVAESRGGGAFSFILDKKQLVD